MTIHWNNGKTTTVKEKSLMSCEAYGSQGFYATSVDGETLLCFYSAISFIELK